MNTEAGIHKPSKLLITGVVILAICVIGTYAAMFIPAFVGASPNPMSGYASIFWSVLFFAMLWKSLNKKKYIGVILGIVFGILAFFSSAFLAGYQRASNQNIQTTQTTEWLQSELTESYMRSISKNTCMLKTIEFLKKCDTDNCLKTMAGVTGDCVTYAKGSISEFCASYNINYTSKYCDSGVLSNNACKVIQVTRSFQCK